MGLKKAEIAEFYRLLADRTPNPETELESVNDFTLLVAVVLSAQATDAGVNLATRKLFKTVTTPQAMQALAQKYLAARPGFRLAVIPQGQELVRAPAAGQAPSAGR